MGHTDNAGGSCGFDGIMRGTENLPIFVGDFQLPSDARTLPPAHRQRAAPAAGSHLRRIDTRRPIGGLVLAHSYTDGLLAAQ